jgi:hemoglobin
MMTDADDIPSLAEWAGGRERLAALFEAFYAKVPSDPVLAPVFAGMDPAHASHVAAFVGEVLGGEAAYSGAGGSHAGMIAKHMGRGLTETQRKRWIALMLDTADAVGLPDDPEFRAALVGYLEWGTRLAVINSAKGAAAPEPGLPMPKWGWGPPGGPYRA